VSPVALLQLAAEFRRRAAAAQLPEKADLIFLAQEYEAAARIAPMDKEGSFSVKLPK